ncbi:MAG: serine/threonine protein kinase [Prochloraceae cyanobacterium]
MQIEVPGYSIRSILGKNAAGGRVTYQAVREKDNLPVVIKQFQFASSDSDWSAYAAVENEISALKRLNHPQIPKYLDCIETENGLAIVTQYIDAPHLSCLSHYSPDEVKQIALSLLDILVYLQGLNPSIIHRDIKPENILIDRDGKVYLVDFGFAKLTDSAVGVSSVVKGTPGFMPIEQLYNRELTLSSDLYSLGVTLVCLLTNTRSVDVNKLLDDRFEIRFDRLIDVISYDFYEWLTALTATRPKSRFSNASVARKSLVDINPAQILPAPVEIIEGVDSFTIEESKSSNKLSIFENIKISLLVLSAGGIAIAIATPFFTSFDPTTFIPPTPPASPHSFSCEGLFCAPFEYLASELPVEMIPKLSLIHYFFTAGTFVFFALMIIFGLQRLRDGESHNEFFKAISIFLFFLFGAEIVSKFLFS